MQMTWFKDLNVPEIFGFLHNQVTPFEIPSSGIGSIYAWHILPTGTYRRYEQDLQQDASEFALDVTTRKSFSVLQKDPEALLIVHFHGAGGSVGSGYRCPNYRALCAGHPDKIHVLAFDYRGSGRSKGVPTERSVIVDAISVSLGTAVNIAIAEHYSHQKPPVSFVGHVLTVPFVDVPTLVSTYSVAGTVPILGLVAKWSTRDRIASYVKNNEANKMPCQITIIHAEDDYDIPWTHTPQLFWHAVDASQAGEIAFEELGEVKAKSKVDLGYAEILKYGLHDVIMGNPIISLTVLRVFEVHAGRASSLCNN
ncbi:hypothetical protein CERZMDRAFT_114794 [Cercospora zeae-maydis SCOH1-5]|uniref:AB hydrolase-1 domain-containing protein n=1 Tax=Cercospora zeae-maydis SCOH1-5 TaxID=717836 RepID=A0A6A6F0P8_9PEZI|nr:hypothetical protein CERZMDRAFT_114794 [Cercospora zeae-maydis SCOH1-5]